MRARRLFLLRSSIDTEEEEALLHDAVPGPPRITSTSAALVAAASERAARAEALAAELEAELERLSGGTGRVTRPERGGEGEEEELRPEHTTDDPFSCGEPLGDQKGA